MLKPTQTIKFLSLILILGTILNACGSSGDPEIAPEQEINCPTTTNLLGTWEAIDQRDNSRNTFTYNEDGRVEFKIVDRFGETFSEAEGTFSIDGTNLTRDLKISSIETDPSTGEKTTEVQLQFSVVPFFVNDTLLSTSVFYPEGNTDGVVGVWTMTRRFEVTNKTTLDDRLEIRPELTAVFKEAIKTETTSSGEAPVIEESEIESKGSIEDLGDGNFKFFPAPGEPRPKAPTSFQLIDNQALATGLIFRRQGCKN